MSDNNLDNLNKIKQLDTKNMLGSLQMLGKQVEQVWQEARVVKIPKSYKNISNVLILGMGGSTLGVDVLKALFKEQLKVPVEVLRDYDVPNFVNKNTLVIASSYSGNTEEPINAVKQAKNKLAKVIVFCAGGELAVWARKNKIVSLIFTTKNNPSNQPRMGQGYLLFGLLMLLGQLDLIKFSRLQVNNVVGALVNYDNIFGVNNPLINNPAKQLAAAVGQSTVWYVAAEHLFGNAHAAANQLNENGKRFGGYFILPELNHHLLEGLRFPVANKQNLLFVLLKSDLYGSRICKRYKITEQVLNKNGIQYFSYQCQGKNKLEQVCEILAFGGYVSFYLALLVGIDPSPIPYVDYFKEQMAG